jgi:formylglycine-generating enzyme required for sulfatase activity
VDERLETLFARGIDPEDEGAAEAASSATAVWPSREDVQAYARRADAAILDVLRTSHLDSIGRPAMRRLEAVYAALEHEQMHQETLMYMWHQLPYELKRSPDGYRPVAGGASPAPGTVRVPSGTATLGADPLRDPFWWDNEYPPMQVDVPAFDVDLFPVTNRDFLQFVEAGQEPPHFWARRDGAWFWRGMFEELPLPMAWPAWVTWHQADAYARWKGRRLPTEAEYHRAAFGDPARGERTFPWGDEPLDDDAMSRAVVDFASFDPAPVGGRPAGASAWGVHDLIGNGWEWTSTVFAGFPGFEPMPSYPEYSADFFDGQHYVMKGASPVTPRELVRRSFRNWFRPDYPYMFAKFRTVG